MKDAGTGNLFESVRHTERSLAKFMITGVRNSTYHWHYDYEIILVLRGRIEVFYGSYGSEYQELKDGDMILINAKGVHSVRSIDTDNICLVIQFDPSLLEPVPAGMKYHFYMNSTSEQYLPRKPYEYFARLCARIGLEERRGKEHSRLRKHGIFLTLLADILESVQYELRSVPENSEEDANLAMRISDYVDQNLLEESISEQICREFGLSEKSVYRLLKDVTGQTLKEMVDAARINAACKLLRDPHIPLQIVSDRCGYSGEATFYRRFRSAMGITPGEYRKGAQASEVSHDVHDYLRFDESEADLLLIKWAGLEERFS